jgi:hypothetical protein
VAKVVYSGSGLLLVSDSSLPPGFEASRVTAEREGQTVSVLARTADGLLLYGPGYEDEYTDEDVYFLRPTRRATGIPSAPYARAGRNRGAAAERTTEATATVKFHEVYYDWSTWREGYYYDYDPWFSKQYLTNATTATYTVSAPGATSAAGRLAVNLWSFSDLAAVTPDHQLRAYVNGKLAGEVSWDGGHQALTVSFTVPAGVLVDGANKVELYTVPLAGKGWQFGLVYSVSVTYTRKLSGPGALEVAAKEGGAGWEEAVGFATQEVYVVDRTDASAPKLVEYEWYAEKDGTYTVRFVRRPGREYVIVPRGSEKQPLSVALRYIEPLNAGVKYLAVGAGRFENALQPLLAQRTKEGLGAAFGEQERVFDAYGWGRYGPEGIRRAVRLVGPRYLLLVGSTKYDYRNYEGQTGDRGCPTFLAETSMLSQAPGDPLFGDLGRGYPEVAVGRYPAKDENELSVGVGRALSYTGRKSESGPWGLMVADKPDVSAGDFGGEADGVVGKAVQWEWERAYQGVDGVTAEAVRAQIVAAAGSGDVIGYVGHGSAAALGKEKLVTTGTVSGWTGNVVLVMATCNGNYFLIDVPTLARGLLFQGGGGAAATIGPTTYVQSGPTTQVMGVLMGAARGGARWGEALLAGQQEAYGRSLGRMGTYDDLTRAETLLGDPALPVEQVGAPAAPAGVPPPKTDAGSF